MMQSNIQRTANRLIASKNFKKRLYMTAGLLGLVVLFTVFYALSVPAVTMEGSLVCELEEHIHIDACYGDILVCGEEETAVSDAQDATEWVLDCDLDEGHTHGEECDGEEVILVCTLEEEETDIHEHNADCYEISQTLICQEEHEHEPGCYENDSFLVCTVEEFVHVEHLHSAECYTVEHIFVCSQEELEGHTHEVDCYIEGPAENVEENGTVHEHSSECYDRDVVCGYEEHVHSEDCYATEASIMGLSAGLFSSGSSSSELDNFLSDGGIILTDLEGHPLTDGIIIGESYWIKLKFGESSSGIQFAYNAEGFLTYQLPDEVKVPVAQEGPIMGNNSAEVGFFSIDLAGKVTVKFINVDLDGNATEQNFIDNALNVMFYLDIKAKFENVSNGQVIDFGDNASITVTVDDQAKLDVKKSASAFDHDKQTIDYKITITAQNGTVTLNQLVDTLTLSGLKTTPLNDLFADDDKIIVSWTENDTLKTAEYTIDQLTVDGYKFTLPLDGITLKSNESATVEYTLHLGKAMEGYDQYTASASNKAVVTGTDDKGNPITRNAEKKVSIVKGDMLNKEYVKVGTQSGVKFIEWVAYVGDGATDLSGATITDTFGSGLTYNADIFGLVIVDQTNGANNALSGYELTVNENDDGFTFTVPNTGKKITKLKLTYKTAFNNQESPTGSFNNTIDISFPDNRHEGGSHTVETDVPASVWKLNVKKTSQLTTENDSDYIDYTIEVFIPANYLGESLSIQDVLFGGYKINYDEKVDVFFENSPVDMKVMSRNAGQDASENEPLDTNTYIFLNFEERGRKAYSNKSQWLICFKEKDYTNTDNYLANSRSPFAEDTILTITYKIPLNARMLKQGDTKTISTSPAMTLKEYMHVNFGTRDIYNQAAAINSNWGWIAYANNLQSWPIHKSGKWRASETTEKIIDYVVVLTSPEYEAWASSGSPTPPVFIDTFDSRLEYVPDSFMIQVKSRANSYDLYVKNTSGTDNTASYITDNGDGTSTLSFNFTDFNTVKIGNIFAALPEEMEDWYTRPGNEYTVKYSLKLNDAIAAEPGLIVLDNTAEIVFNIDGKEKVFQDDFSVDYGEKVVMKNMVAAGNTASVTISINCECLDIAKDSDTFVMRDIMSDNLAFYLSTIEVKFQDKISGTWQTANLTQNSHDLWGYTTNGDNEISMTLPDETIILITYKALIKGAEGAEVNIENEVWVNGHYDVAAIPSFEIVEVSAGGSYSKAKLQVVKDDSLQNNVYLDGAVFDLYTDYAYAGYDSEKTTVIDDVTFYYVATGETGVDDQIKGTYTFKHDSIIPNEGHLYALIETQAPEGYILPQGDDAITLVYFDVFEDEYSKTPQQITDFVSISNDPYHTMLPETGGRGTSIYYLAGLALMSLAGVVILARVKKGGHNVA